MRTLTLGFSRSTKKFAIFSWALQAWDKVPYSHVYFKFENSRNPDIPLIYQASGTMLNFMSEEVFLEHNKVVEEYPLKVSDEAYNDILRDCMKFAGRPYGKWQIIGIALADILKLKKNLFANKDKLFVCSEWSAKQMKRLGYIFYKDNDLVKPIDINDAVKLQLKL